MPRKVRKDQRGRIATLLMKPLGRCATSAFSLVEVIVAIGLLVLSALIFGAGLTGQIATSGARIANESYDDFYSAFETYLVHSISEYSNQGYIDPKIGWAQLPQLLGSQIALVARPKYINFKPLVDADAPADMKKNAGYCKTPIIPERGAKGLNTNPATGGDNRVQFCVMISRVPDAATTGWSFLRNFNVFAIVNITAVDYYGRRTDNLYDDVDGYWIFYSMYWSRNPGGQGVRYFSRHRSIFRQKL